MDLKCPGSGMSGRMRLENLALLKPTTSQIRPADRKDYEHTRRLIRRHGLAERCVVLLSTVHDRLAPRQAVEWLLADRLPVRFQLQLHKYIWPPETRKV